MNFIDKIIDKYLKYPILIDFLLVLVVWSFSKNIELFNFTLIDKPNQVNLLSNIISTDVSLAGFILAALTIIISFKSNLQSKGVESPSNALDLILNTKHYNSIVKTFKKSILEFVICFITMFIIWASVDNLSIYTLNRFCVSGILVTSIALLRSLYILLSVLSLENYKNEE